MQHISAHQLADWLADGSRPQPFLLDVREPWEFELAHVAGSRHLPMPSIPESTAEIPPEGDIVVICHHGVRSLHVAMFLERAGFSAIHNLTGGIDAWASTIDPAMRRY